MSSRVKSPDKLTMLGMIDEVPALKDVPGFREILDRIPDDFDMAAFDEELKADLEAMQKEQADPDHWTMKPPTVTTPPAPHRPPSATGTSSKSRRITVRIPASILAELRVTARAKGIGYQTALNRILKAGLAGL